MKLSPLLVSSLLAALAANGWAAPLKLRVLETSDVHMNLLDYDYYQDKPTQDFGLARAATLIRAARQEARNSLLMTTAICCRAIPWAIWWPRFSRCAPARFIPPTKCSTGWVTTPAISATTNSITACPFSARR